MTESCKTAAFSRKTLSPDFNVNCRGLLNGIKSRVTKKKNGTWENASADAKHPTPELGSSSLGHLHPENRSSTSDWDRKN